MLLILYIIYYIYFKNPGRSKRQWDKYYFTQPEQMIKVETVPDDFNYDKSTSHINDWIKRRQLGIGGRPYTCDRANSVGVGCGDCHLDKKKKWMLQ